MIDLKPVAAFVRYTVQPILKELKTILKMSKKQKIDLDKLLDTLSLLYLRYLVAWSSIAIIATLIISGALIVCFNGSGLRK